MCFSSTGNRVKNNIKAQFTIQYVKIVDDVDTFDFHRWVPQALRIKGVLFGWALFVKRKVQSSAMATLQDYIQYHANK